MGFQLKKVKRRSPFRRTGRNELNAKKCKEMIIDLRKNKTILQTKIGDRDIVRVNSYKLLRTWLDDDIQVVNEYGVHYQKGD